LALIQVEEFQKNLEEMEVSSSKEKNYSLAERYCNQNQKIGRIKDGLLFFLDLPLVDVTIEVIQLESLLILF